MTVRKQCWLDLMMKKSTPWAQSTRVDKNKKMTSNISFRPDKIVEADIVKNQPNHLSLVASTHNQWAPEADDESCHIPSLRRITQKEKLIQLRSWNLCYATALLLLRNTAKLSIIWKTNIFPEQQHLIWMIFKCPEMSKTENSIKK